MSKYRTAQGKVLDMAALAAKNEKVRAVGNAKVNARGDTIDGTGRIIRSATQKVSDGYAKTVSNRGARLNRKTDAATTQTNNQIKDPEVTDTEMKELKELDTDADEVEQIKAKERKKK